MKHTQEEKKAYFKKLREDWATNKKMAEGDDKMKAVYKEAGISGVSYWGFVMIKMQMDALGLEGLPCIDAKTFAGWKASGFKVKKGEKSKMHGITWIGSSKDEDEEDEYVFPKQYHLFHKSQVEELK